jgi:hypothetical protein
MNMGFYMPRGGRTNEYGLLHAKRWKDISRKDLEYFLLCCSSQVSRKEKTNLLIGFPTIVYWRIR